jgi:hypothetical protein
LLGGADGILLLPLFCTLSKYAWGLYPFIVLPGVLRVAIALECSTAAVDELDLLEPIEGGEDLAAA